MVILKTPFRLESCAAGMMFRGAPASGVQFLVSGSVQHQPVELRTERAGLRVGELKPDIGISHVRLPDGGPGLEIGRGLDFIPVSRLDRKLDQRRVAGVRALAQGEDAAD